MTVADRERRLERERELNESLSKRFAGQWVAIHDEEVIAHATSPEDLHEHLSTESRPYHTFRVTRGSALL